MASTDPKMRSIAGLLVPNCLTEREDDFTFNVTYLANRTVKDLCKMVTTIWKLPPNTTTAKPCSKRCSVTVSATG